MAMSTQSADVSAKLRFGQASEVTSDSGDHIDSATANHQNQLGIMRKGSVLQPLAAVIWSSMIIPHKSCD